LEKHGKTTPAALAKLTGLDTGYVTRWCDAAFLALTLPPIEKRELAVTPHVALAR
jgi:hypothetical protein